MNALLCVSEKVCYYSQTKAARNYYLSAANIYTTYIDATPMIWREPRMRHAYIYLQNNSLLSFSLFLEGSHISNFMLHSLPLANIHFKVRREHEVEFAIAQAICEAEILREYVSWYADTPPRHVAATIIKVADMTSYTTSPASLLLIILPLAAIVWCAIPFSLWLLPSSSDRIGRYSPFQRGDCYAIMNKKRCTLPPLICRLN